MTNETKIDNSLPTATIQPAALQGEPDTDKAFRSVATGNIYRVRLAAVSSDRISVHGVTAAPFIERFDVTLTQLDDDGNVLRAGGDVVFVAHTGMTIDHSQTPGTLDVRGQIDMTIQHLVWQADQRGTTQIEVSDVLAEWGGGVREPKRIDVYLPPSLEAVVIAEYVPPASPAGESELFVSTSVDDGDQAGGEP